MAHRGQLSTLIVLFAIALAVRVAFAFIPADRTSGDQQQYQELARNLQINHTFGSGSTPGAHRAPLYPMILAGLGGTATLVLQVIAGSALAPLVYLLAVRLVAPFWATLAGLGMAASPMSSRYCTLFMTETLFTFLVVLGALFWAMRKPAACGICFGLATLIRPVLFPFVLLLPLFAFKRAYRSVIVITACAFATQAPWAVRNAVVLHRFVPVATAGWGSNLFQGTLDVPSEDPWPYIMRERGEDLQPVLLKRGLARIYENPRAWLIVRLKQYPVLFLDDGEYIGTWAKPLLWTGNLLLLALAGIGWWRLRPAPYVWAYPAYTAVSQLPMWTEPRYSLPIIPFLLVLAAGAFASARATTA